MNKPWMPLYIGKYLSKTSHLNAAQSGAYLHLIMHYWQNGSLPADESALARIGRMTEPEWKKNRSVLAAFFYDGWKNKTAEEELAKAEQISNARRASAMQRHCKSDANAEQLQSKSTHTRGVIVSSLPLLPTSLGSKEDSEEQASGRKQRKRGEKTPLPADLRPEFHVADRLGWSQSKRNIELERFCTSAKAHDRRYVNWQMAFDQWCLSPYQKQETSDGLDRESGKQAFKRAVLELKEYGQAPTDGESGGEAIRLLPAAGIRE